jgi:hypothetical protein
MEDFLKGETLGLMGRKPWYLNNLPSCIRGEEAELGHDKF